MFVGQNGRSRGVAPFVILQRWTARLKSCPSTIPAGDGTRSSLRSRFCHIAEIVGTTEVVPFHKPFPSFHKPFPLLPQTFPFTFTNLSLHFTNLSLHSTLRKRY